MPPASALSRRSIADEGDDLVCSLGSIAISGRGNPDLSSDIERMPMLNLPAIGATTLSGAAAAHLIDEADDVLVSVR
jgi:hypothetical protein